MNLSRRARQLGVRIHVADLGDWDGLGAEYDARARVIRVSARRMRELRAKARRRFFVRAVAHELYHHLECVGVIARLPTHAQREAAADEFASAAVA